LYPSTRSKIEDYLNKYYQSTTMHLRIIEAPEGSGSADALREVRNYIDSDFLVMSCDLVTDFKLQSVIDAHTLRNATMTCLFYNESPVDGDKPAKDAHANPGLFVVTDSSSRLLQVTSKADAGDELDIKTSIIKLFPHLRVSSQLQDAHLYVFKKWVLELLHKDKSMTNVRADLIPFLLACQHRPDFVEREGVDKLLESNADYLAPARAMSSSGIKARNQVWCSAVVYKEGFTCRLSTVANYTHINRWFLKSFPDATRIAATAEIHQKTQVIPLKRLDLIVLLARAHLWMNDAESSGQ
jgi:translation initiation factor eIF-2B subunit gamma